MGGYYLSSHTLLNSLYGSVHSFVMGTSITSPDDILPGVYIRRLVHYFHTSYVVNNLIDTGNDPSLRYAMNADEILLQRTITTTF